MSVVGERPIVAIGISGSPSVRSRSRALIVCVLDELEGLGARTTVVDLSAMDAHALLGRAQSTELTDAIGAVANADIIVASTPVYRATYTGLLKLFFDALPLHALSGKVALALATGASAGHASVIDHGLRPLFGSLDALIAPTGVFATDAEFADGVPDAALASRARLAARESFTLAGSLRAAGVLSSIAEP